MNSSDTYFRLEPLQVLTDDNKVLLKRGNLEFFVSGANARGLVRELLALFQDNGAGRDEVILHLSKSPDGALRQVFKELVARRMIVETRHAEPPQEDRVDVHYWHFETNAATARRAFRSAMWDIVGVNDISSTLCSVLIGRGAERIRVIDYPLFRNLSYYDTKNQLRRDLWGSGLPQFVSSDEFLKMGDDLSSGHLILTSDFGGGDSFRPWNHECLRRGWKVFPVMIDGWIGLIGPALGGGGGPCFECLRARENANLDIPRLERLSDRSAFEGQTVRQSAPGLANVVSELAAAELERDILKTVPSRGYPTLLELNWLDSSISHRRVLRLPNCTACGPTPSPVLHATAELREIFSEA